MICYLLHLTSVHINELVLEISNSGLALLLDNVSNDDDNGNELSSCGLTDNETLSNDEEEAQKEDDNKDNSGDIASI